MLNWYFVTQAQYDAAAGSRSSENLYFTSDTKQIYRGDDLFTESVSFYTELPTKPAVGKLYVDSTTLEGKVYTGSAWKTVIKPVDDEVTVDGANPVSGAAVATYVTEALKTASAEAKAAFKDVSYAKATNKLTFTKNDGTTKEVEIDNLPVDLVYDKSGSVGLLQLKDAAGAAIGTGINLDLERFVKSGEYDAETKKITLYFDDAKTDKVEIDASALVDIYTGAATSTASTTVSADNKISVAVKVSSEEGNTVVAKEDGLYVAPTDLSGKQDKDADAVAGNIATFEAGGNTVDSGKKIGGAALAETPDANTLATEKAVDAVRGTLTTSIATAQSAAEAAQADATKGINDAKAAKEAADAAQADATKGIADAAAAKKAADDAAAAVTAEQERATGKENELIAALTWKTTIA